MNLLEYYHNQHPTNDQFVIRKCHIPTQGHINLYGVRASGKTAIVLDILQETSDALYIDLDDPNLLLHTLDIPALQQFIQKEKLSLLILDHYTEGRLPHFPKIENIIVLSRTPIATASFSHVELFPLDYEEFLAFESGTTQHRGLNHFLRSGTLPIAARAQKTHTQSMKTFFQSSFTPAEQQLLLILAQHHTKHLTTHQIYTFAKEKFKVSKDWVYKTIKAFKEEKLLLFIDDLQEKSGKKMFLFDFAFAKYLTLGQPFILQFDTMIALALIKHHIDVKTLGIHGYISKEKELILPAPFESEESLWVKSQKKFSLYKKQDIHKVTIITVANHYSYTIDAIHFEALPFDEWSITILEYTEL